LQKELEKNTKERSKHLMKMNQDLEQHVIETENAKAALQESEERYKTLTKMVPVGLFQTKPDVSLLIF
jgi:C4-dicarboxylate-specific signal transduction histidine kinase